MICCWEGQPHQHDIIIEDFKVKDGYVEVPRSQAWE